MHELLIITFVLGYLLIAFEHPIKVNKAAIAIITGVVSWTIYIHFIPDKHLVNEQLTHHLGELSAILFFLLAAMTIVELIDAHNGFDIITARINLADKRKLLWMLAFLTFFLSAVLDNLTTTIVMISLLRKLVRNHHERLLFTGIIVIAANAGGAWSPIGDVTTTMLWIGGQITAANLSLKLILPSLICLVVPLIILSFTIKGRISGNVSEEKKIASLLTTQHQSIVFVSGILALVFVPVFKTITHLPPYMGILIGLGVLWIITELIHKKKDESIRHSFSVVQALRKIDTSSILFFLGILVSIAALESAGILSWIANWMTRVIASDSMIVLSLGMLSAIVDNVPLVAAAQGMFDLIQYPVDHYFWIFLAYTAGTGGSALIIGSAAGVAAMGLEKINFFWYIRHISLLAVTGYFAGALVYILQHKFFG